jgi:putative selenium metabolism protein SsnA
MDGTKASADALYLDCIKQGVTTIFDHHASYGEIPGTLHTIAESAKTFGIRSCLCYEVSDRDGEEKCLQAIRENADWITECEKNKDPMLAAMFGGHALFTISDKTFDRMVEANNGRTGYHIHVSEGMNDVYDSLQNYGRRPVQRLQDHGILGEKTILGHCIHVNSAEIELIKNTNTMVVNNPESNMGNAVGICPVLPLYKAGILLGMGTDAYTNDMLESIKVALCSQRSNACLPNVAWCEVTDMLFKNNAKIGAKYFPDPLGVLKPGAAADIIVMDYKPFTPFSDANIDGHMIFGMTGRQCQTTIASGRLLMKDRELVGVDEEAVNAHILEAAKKLWGELNHCTY